MAGYINETDYQSLAQALNDYFLVDDLKKMAKLICAEVRVQLISSDTKLSKMCLPAGDGYIVVLPGKGKEFIKALVDSGYIVPQLREQI